MAEQASLIVNSQLLLVVSVTRNRLCQETKSPVLVTFGSTKSMAGGQCEGQKNATEMVISSGATASFHVNAADISLASDETICYTASLDGVPGGLHKCRLIIVINTAYLSSDYRDHC